MWDFLYAIGALVISLGGGAGIVLALSSWLGKVWANRILEADRAKYRKEAERSLQLLRDQIDRGQYVHRLQFEVEFAGYKTLWESLVKARAAAVSLRPIADFVPTDKSKGEIQQERLNSLNEAFSEFLASYTLLEPFFPPVVYEAVSELAHTIRSEGIDYAYGDATSHREYWDNAKNNAEKITAQSEKVRDAIRERVGMCGATQQP